jgi:hypothetical protein
VPTCLEVALHRLSSRPLKESTVKEYLSTLRVLGLCDLAHDEATVRLVNARLQRVLTPSTRRKHAINLRATLGLDIPCPRPTQKVYALPPVSELQTCLEASPYAMWGLVMLFAGLRLGEACVPQPLVGNVLQVDRQRTPSGQVTTAKTCGPVAIPAWLASRYHGHDFARSHNTVYVGIRRAGRKSGLSLNPHQLRHAYATHLVAQGANPEVLRRQMRHHHVSVSLAYYVQVTDTDVADVVARL